MTRAGPPTIACRLVRAGFVGVAICCHLVFGLDSYLGKCINSRYSLIVVVCFFNEFIGGVAVFELLNFSTWQIRIGPATYSFFLVKIAKAGRCGIGVSELVCHSLLRQRNMPYWHSAWTLALELAILVRFQYEICLHFLFIAFYIIWRRWKIILIEWKRIDS